MLMTLVIMTGTAAYSVDGENIVIRRDGSEDEITDYVVGDDTLSLGFEGVDFTRSLI